VYQAGEGDIATCLLICSRSKLNSPSEHQQYGQTQVRSENKSILSTRPELSIIDQMPRTQCGDVQQHTSAGAADACSLRMSLR